MDEKVSEIAAYTTTNELLKNIRLESDDYFSLKLTFTKTLIAYLLNKYI